jgi:hypothetical protein
LTPRAVLGATLLAACSLAGCSSAASDDPGLEASLKIPGAQFHRGTIPTASPDGPAVASIVLLNSFARPGEVDYPISGALGAGATAAAIGLRGDVGYWTVVAGIPAVATPDDPSYAATATLSAGLVAGSYALVVEAVDAAGRFGAPQAQGLTVQSTAPTGAFVITLAWDTESDLDLHVVDAAGVEIDHDQMSDKPPPFAPQPDGGGYGYLDWDSNANCVIDGKRQEDVVWPTAPPSGHYVVRVDAASLCAAVSARWTVEATLNGAAVGKAQGIALDADTREPHGAGAGATALEIDVP